jgi:hypothetical protein
MKGSLNTFLNAFTYPDRTCYPVASANKQVSRGCVIEDNTVRKSCFLAQLVVGACLPLPT